MALSTRAFSSSISRRQFLGVGTRAFIAVGFVTSLTHCAIIPDPEPSTKILVPRGFKPRIVARSGYRPSQNSNYAWHSLPDGGACFDTGDGGWIYVSNCEDDPDGGVGALRFDEKGTLIDAYRILNGTRKNCAGGATPWGTWLSCEEVTSGRVWECDPFGNNDAIAQRRLGVFAHESACVDPLTHEIYLTEDKGDGCLYRFTQDEPVLDGMPNLAQGQLKLAQVIDGYINWIEVPDPQARKIPLRYQVEGSTRFKGGEGIDIYDRFVRFTTKHDNRVWQIDLQDDRITVIQKLPGQVNDVDDITHTPDGKILIAEDGVKMRILYFPENSGPPVTLMQLPEHRYSEITGLAFDPSGTRLYFSSQRGNTDQGEDGISFEIAGDFHDIDSKPQLVEWNLNHNDLSI